MATKARAIKIRRIPNPLQMAHRDGGFLLPEGNVGTLETPVNRNFREALAGKRTGRNLCCAMPPGGPAGTVSELSDYPAAVEADGATIPSTATPTAIVVVPK